MNNFKVGDLITHPSTKNILKVIGVEVGWYLEVIELNNEDQEPEESYVFYFEAKHATPEEIKAGADCEIK